MANRSESPPVLTGDPPPTTKRLASDITQRSRILGDPFDRYQRNASGTVFRGDGTADPEQFTGGIYPPTFRDLTDVGAVADGATDIGPPLSAELAKCITNGVRRLKLPGLVKNVNSYYLLPNGLTIPAMPEIHAGAPKSILTIEGDGYGSTMIAGSITTNGPVHWKGVEFSSNYLINGPDIHAASGGYPHYFTDCEFNSAAIIPLVDCYVYLINCRLQFNGGWVFYFTGSGVHLQAFLTGCEVSAAYIAGGAAANTVDALSLAGGRVGSVYAFTSLVQSPVTLPNGARVGGVFGIANQ